MSTLINRNSSVKNMLSWLPLITICAAVLFLSIPTISNNVNDPNMIVYFNADEGGLMDEAWYYYSGIKRDSFQWDFDYGLEMVYIADAARLVFSKFINFTPGTFVYILRWIHLAAWLLSFVALWRLVRYHFGKNWQPILAVILLATRPAFLYFSSNLKPEPLVLLFMILGLDYALRIVGDRSGKYILLAVGMAAIAFIVKFAGIFLLPAIIAAMYLAKRYHSSIKNVFFRKIKIAWLLPLLIGIGSIIIPMLPIFFYVRKSTGYTWYEQYGLWNSLLQIKLIFCLWFVGLVLIISPLVIHILSKNRYPAVKKIFERVKEVNTYAFIVCGLFFGFLVLFGFKWLINPGHLMTIYGQFGPIACQNTVFLHKVAEKGFLMYFLDKLTDRFMIFDAAVMTLFIFYLYVETRYRRISMKMDTLNLFKRLVIVVFLIFPCMIIFSPMRMEQHNMLPFFVAALILALQGINMFRSMFTGSIFIKRLVLALIGVMLLADASINGFEITKSMIQRSYHEEDVAFIVKKWWRENIPVDARVLADNYNSVYIPSYHKSVKTLRWNQAGRVEELRQLAASYKPRFIYCNENADGSGPTPSIEILLPGKRVKFVKSFSSAGRAYQKDPKNKFVIYEVMD